MLVTMQQPSQGIETEVLTERLSLRDGLAMPIISRFFGIVVSMHYADHAPPHFHVRYGERKAIVGIEPPIVLRGHLPPRVTGMIIEWATQHQDQLLEDWLLAQSHRPLRSIEPLQ